MNDLSVTLSTTLAVTAAAMLALWLVSLWRRDVSIVDIYWGPGFVLIGWVAWLLNAGGSRGTLVALLVSVWGLRLGGYLWLRNRGKDEDYRYAAMRKRYGERFAFVSLYLVFGLQMVLMWIVSLPVQAVQVAGPAGLGLLDWLGVALVAVGLFFESVGDYQLARFKADPAHAGMVMDRGLWAWTRHPNYFGDFTVWWGLACFALAAGAWWALIGPLVMSILLLRVSGVALLERGLEKSKPGYADYVRRTPAFFPRPPSR
jgi:steroid 5-alpha reductase family enzyme